MKYPVHLLSSEAGEITFKTIVSSSGKSPEGIQLRKQVLKKLYVNSVRKVNSLVFEPRALSLSLDFFPRLQPKTQILCPHSS